MKGVLQYGKRSSGISCQNHIEQLFLNSSAPLELGREDQSRLTNIKQQIQIYKRLSWMISQ
jgi:hypothetical protein